LFKQTSSKIDIKTTHEGSILLW